MAFVGKPRDEQNYGRLMGMIQPEATPTKRVGTETPIGSTMAGSKGGQTPAEFTKAGGVSPGGVFQRQLQGADISGITNLAQRPLLKEAGQEAARVAGEAKTYQETQAEKLKKQPQFQFGTPEQTSDIVNKLAAGAGPETETAQQIFGRESVPVDKFSTAQIKEFTPLQALRGGTVEGLLKREAEGPYTTGMAGLDALLFQKKGGAAELGERGQALRTTEQMIADLLQGKGQGVAGEAIQKELEKRGLSPDLTKQAEAKAKQFVESQKTGLKTGIEGGLKSREEAYTKAAKEGEQSKLQQAQTKLQQQYAEAYGKTAGERNEYINKLTEDAKNKALEDTIAALRRESIAAQEEAGHNVQGDVTIKIPSRAELLDAAKADKRYQYAIRNIDMQSPYAKQKGVMQQGAVPTMGLANVISPEDAAAYNRLESLIGGQAIQPTAAQFTPGTYNKQEIEEFFKNLMGSTRI